MSAYRILPHLSALGIEPSALTIFYFYIIPYLSLRHITSSYRTLPVATLQNLILNEILTHRAH